MAWLSNLLWRDVSQLFEDVLKQVLPEQNLSIAPLHSNDFMYVPISGVISILIGI